MKVPVQVNPPSELGKSYEDFPKLCVDLELLLSRFPALYSDFAVVSALSCICALKAARTPSLSERRPIWEIEVQRILAKKGRRPIPLT